jgi:hypothetical protein
VSKIIQAAERRTKLLKGIRKMYEHDLNHLVKMSAKKAVCILTPLRASSYSLTPLGIDWHRLDHLSAS